MSFEINAERLLARLRQLGRIGRDASGVLRRVAASDADRAGRDQLVAWIGEAGLEVAIDAIGNIYGIWRPEGVADEPPVLSGSHIDSVVNAGIYDGCLGVLAALEVVQTLKEGGFVPARPMAIAAFTDEEGVRFQPDMLGSLVAVGGLALEEARARPASDDGALLGAELDRIGYTGPHAPGFLTPASFVELHIEQGPILDHEGVRLGAVENLQGISWQRITIAGQANHAGTTPMALRHDAGLVAARVAGFVVDYARGVGAPMVATVGSLEFRPNVINVVPARAVLTVDLRDPDGARLAAAEAALAAKLAELAEAEGVGITAEPLARFGTVVFDERIVAMIEDSACARALSCRRMTSGAGQDAQMLARICPTAMIFVPSIKGISHNPAEFTPPDDVIAGASVLLDVLRRLATE